VCATLSMFQPRMGFLCSPVSIALKEFFDRGGLLAGGVIPGHKRAQDRVD